MNIFQMKTAPLGIERADEFINEGYVCIGYPNIGDLSNTEKDEIREILRNQYGHAGSQLGNHLGIVNAFVNTMEEGDIVLIAKNDWVHIGELGEYVFESKYDDDGLSHRRYVKWLKTVEKYRLNEYVNELLRNRSIVTKFKHPNKIAELNEILNDTSLKKVSKNIDENTVEKAINILKKALDSENEDIRTRAAIELLNMSKK